MRAVPNTLGLESLLTKSPGREMRGYRYMRPVRTSCGRV